MANIMMVKKFVKELLEIEIGEKLKGTFIFIKYLKRQPLKR